MATPQPAAVPGMSCMSPCAPTTLTAEGSPPDSAITTARTRPTGTPSAAAALETSEFNVAGSSECEEYGKYEPPLHP